MGLKHRDKPATPIIPPRHVDYPAGTKPAPIVPPRKPILPTGSRPAPSFAQKATAPPSRVTFDLIPQRPGWFSIKAPITEKDLIKSIPGREWAQKEHKRKQWEIPFDSFETALNRFPHANVMNRLREQVEVAQAKRQRVIDAKTADVEIEVPGLKATLRPYQKQGLAFLDEVERGEGAVLAYDMGLGKTLIGIAFALRKIQQGLAKHCLIVCPAPLKYTTWAEEIEQWTSEEYMVIDGDRSEEVEEEDGSISKLEGRELREVQYLQYLNGVKFTVANYEMFLHDAPSEESEAWKRVKDLAKRATAELEEILANALKHIPEEDYYARKDAEKAVFEGYVRLYYGDEWQEYELRRTSSKKTPFAIYKRLTVKDIIPKLNRDWIVILDEAHRIKSPNAETTRNLMKKIAGAGYKVLGTGTPLENNIEEVWQLIDLCKPGLLGNFYQFKNRYMEKDYWGKFVGPYRERIPELKERIEPVMIRKTKQEALPDLPELIRMDYWVDMTGAQAELYDQVKGGILEGADGETTYIEALAQLTRFQQICDSPALLRNYLENEELPEESGKLLALPYILSDIRPDENKVIIFTQYATMVAILERRIRSWYPQFDLVTFTGDITNERIRAENKRKFQEDPNCRFFIMTTAGNYGLNLQAASYVIAYDETWNPQKMEQVYSRAHRGGQTQQVTAINLKTRETYEERKHLMLKSKRDLFDGFINDDDAAFARLMGSAKDILKLI